MVDLLFLLAFCVGFMAWAIFVVTELLKERRQDKDMASRKEEFARRRRGTDPDVAMAWIADKLPRAMAQDPGEMVLGSRISLTQVKQGEWTLSCRSFNRHLGGAEPQER